jgi:hypothetical protein
MRPLADSVARRRRWWLTPPAVALLRALWVWGQLPPDSENTVWVSFYPDVGPDPRGGGKGAKGLVALAVQRGRLADPGPLAERVAALVAPTTHRSPALVYENLDGSFKLVDVHLTEPLVPRRVDTQAAQQALAAAGSAGLWCAWTWRSARRSCPAARQRLGSALATTGCHVSGGLRPEGRRSGSRCAPSPRPKAGLEPGAKVANQHERTSDVLSWLMLDRSCGCRKLTRRPGPAASQRGWRSAMIASHGAATALPDLLPAHRLAHIAGPRAGV